MNYAIYSITPGRILRTVACSSDTIELQLRAGEAYIEVSNGINDATHYINSSGQLTPYPEKPSQFHVFDFNAGTYSDPRTLQDFKDLKWREIKQARTAYLNSPITTPYGVFDGDPTSQDNIKGAIQLSDKLLAFSQPSDITFTLADNSRVTLTNAELNTVGFVLGAKTNAAHEASSILRTQIDAATTREELDLIVWTL